MKLFENGVGRPSNEILKKRRMFIVSIVAVVALILTVGGVLLSRSFNTNELKGAANPNYTNANTALEIKFNGIRCDKGSKKCEDKKIDLSLNAKGKYVKYVSTVTCTKLSDCTRSDAWDKATSRNRTGRWPVSSKNTTIKIKDDNQNIEGRKFYVRVTAYSSNSESDWVRTYVYILTPDEFNNKKWSVISYLTSDEFNEKYFKPMTLSCEASGLIWEDITCYVTTNGKALSGAEVSTYTGAASVKKVKDNKYSVNYNPELYYFSNEKKQKNGKNYVKAKVTAKKEGYKTATDYIEIYERPMTLGCEASKDVGNPVKCYVTTNGEKYSSAKLTVADSSIASIKKVGGKYAITFNNKLFTKYKKQIKTKDGRKYIKAKVTAKSNGYITAVDYVEIYEAKPLKLSCGASVLQREPVTCNVTSNGKAIKGAKLTVADSSIATIKNTSDNKFSVTFNDYLFLKYSDQLKYDSGNGYYINAKVTAKLSGYKNATTLVKVYKNPAMVLENFGRNAIGSPADYKIYQYKTNKVVTDATIKTADSSIATIKKKADQKYNISFNKNLFTKYKSQVKTDGGKKYIDVKLTITSPKYGETITLIRVYEK